MTGDTPQPRFAAVTSRSPDALHREALEHLAAQDMERAFGLQLQAAQAGHARARIETGRMLLYGVGCTADPLRAVHWLRLAETQGEPVASYHLALIAVGNRAMPRDADIDRRVLACVQRRHVPSLRAAAIHFGRKPHASDQALCVQLLEDAAASGDNISAALLAERLQRGEGVPADPAAAAELRARLQEAGMPPLPAIDAPAPQHPPCPARSMDLRDATFTPTVDLRAERPRVGVIDGLLSADECRLLVACARPSLRASQTVDPDTGLPVRLPLRTSSDTNFDPVQEDLALRLLQLRIAAATGVELVHGEPLVVLRYAPGEQYRPHRDYVPPGTLERDHPQAGNRARTVCVYLNAVEAGGETEFPVAALRVAPVPGRAVVFDNLLPDGQPDVDSLHAGLPVQRGEKWLATLWLRQAPYRDY
jgi:prolyl 4-hydroxylase